MKKIIIGFDYDGVITNSLYILPYINHVYGQNVKPWQVSSYNFNDIFGIKIDWEAKTMGVTLDSIFTKSEWLPYSTEVLEELINLENVEVNIITARGQNKEDITKRIFASRLTRLPKFNFVGHTNKIDILKNLGIDIMFEDSPENILQLRDAGFRVVIFDQPYNKHIPGERVYSWLDLISFLKKEFNIKEA